MKLKNGDLMTTTEVARALGLSPDMVIKMRRQARIPAIRTVGKQGQWIFLTRDVNALIEKRRNAPRGTKRGFVMVPPP